MRVRLFSLVPLMNISGPETGRSETVTMFNDLCLFAPTALLDAPVAWHSVDATHVRGTFSNGAQKVTADLVFDADGGLVDFVSDDRLRASGDGKSFLAQRWSTPVRKHLSLDGRRLITHGEGRWHASEPEGEFSYLELDIDEIAYAVTSAHSLGARDPVASPEQHEACAQRA
jgi:hypothetical protein